LVAKERNDLLRSLNTAMLSGKPKINEKTGKVIFGEIDPTKKKIVDNILDKAKADKKTRSAIYNNINSIRNGWGEMFSSLGGKLEGQQFKQFKDLFGK